MRATSDLTQTPSIRRVDAFDELVEIRLTVERLRADLLDYNPLLAIMAESLQKALDLELEFLRCNVLGGDAA
ncbi:MAG: hypothetical protein JWN07_548 [Hyphomicrobiales bacterium]|nr:hypothetical protein [Hyphomicrobiales bacterium]